MDKVRECVEGLKFHLQHLREKFEITPFLFTSKDLPEEFEDTDIYRILSFAIRILERLEKPDVIMKCMVDNSYLLAQSLLTELTRERKEK